MQGQGSSSPTSAGSPKPSCKEPSTTPSPDDLPLSACELLEDREHQPPACAWCWRSRPELLRDNVVNSVAVFVLESPAKLDLPHGRLRRWRSLTRAFRISSSIMWIFAAGGRARQIGFVASLSGSRAGASAGARRLTGKPRPVFEEGRMAAIAFSRGCSTPNAARKKNWFHDQPGSTMPDHEQRRRPH